jgi:poly-beta-1,6-N-acetyl-D-glucosamine biosynthesis protein PgaD
MTEPVKPQWPPLVGNRRLPLLILLRDALLTLAAWLLLGYLMRDAIQLAWDYLRHPLFELTAMEPPDWDAIQGHLKRYRPFIIVLVGWLMFWGYTSRHALSASKPRPAPPALEPEQHAVAFRIDPVQLRGWQASRGLVFHFDESGSIRSVEMQRQPERG